MNIFLILFVALMVRVSLLFFEAFKQRNYSKIGAAIPRLYLASLILFFTVTGSLDHSYIFTALLVVIISDIILSIIHQYTSYYTRSEELLRVAKLLHNLQDKYALIIENPFIGYFTIDTQGTIEFANQTFNNMVGEKSLVGKNIFSYIGDITIEEVLNKKQVDCVYNLTTKNGETKSVRVSAAYTENGHVTITGSVSDIGQAC